MLRLVPGGRIPEGARLVARLGDIVTVRTAAHAVPELREAAPVWSAKAPRLLAAEPAIDLSREPVTERDVGARRADDSAAGRGVVVAVLDWGCDVAHSDFRRPDGGTRLLALWDQRGGSRADSPAPYGYGRLLTATDIDRALLTGAPYEALGYHPGDADTDGSGTHGTHVLSIAAGSGTGSPEDPVGRAPQADLIFVHLAPTGTGGLANLGDSATLLEAIHFVHEAAGDRPCVINASVGRHGGPHDGSTLVEMALDWLVTAHDGRCVVQSCGNYQQSDTHTAGRLFPGESVSLHWSVDEVDRTPNELEVWYPGDDQFSATVVTPDGSVSVAVDRGAAAPIMRGSEHVGHVYHRTFDPNNGRHHLNVFLGTGAPAGEWEVRLTGIDVVDGRYHAWVERDASCPGCQSRFDPMQAVNRSTTGTICHARHGIAVGAYDPHDSTMPIARFSSSGPTVDGRGKPDCLAPGVSVLAARSAPRESDVATDEYTRKSGTSMAAPFVAGTIACMYEAAGGPVGIVELRAALVSACIPVAGWPVERSGAGYLDPAAAARALVDGRRPGDGSPSGGAHARTDALMAAAHREGVHMSTDSPISPVPELTPGALFDTIVYGTRPDLRRHIERRVRIVGYPGEADVGVLPGDVEIARVYGEGQLAVVSPAADGGQRALAGSLVLRPVEQSERQGCACNAQENSALSSTADADAAESTPELRIGARGPDVRRLQRALADAGIEVIVDGVFGDRTAAAVVELQRLHGLVGDGVVGTRTWAVLDGTSATLSRPAEPGNVSDAALGVLRLRAPSRTYDYQFTGTDLLWSAKFLVHEAGGRDDPDNAAVLWAMFNRYALFTHRAYRTFETFIRAYSTTLQPELRNPGAAARHRNAPPGVFVRTGGVYPGTDIPRGQLRRHLEIQAAPWNEIRETARELATRALSGGLPNPGIGLASQFASTRIYFRQRHHRNPNPQEWREYTERLAARRGWRWVGEVPGIDQMRNAFFLDLRSAGLPRNVVRIDPPVRAGTQAPVLRSTFGDVADRPSEQDPHGPPASQGVPFAADPPPGARFPVRSTDPRASSISYTTSAGGIVGNASRRFGALRSGGTRRHAGVDVYARAGDEVIASQDGVILAFYGFCCGTRKTTWALVVDHGGVAINYGEVTPDSLHRLGLKRGDRVSAGQVIGYIGRNPRGSSMLHLEMYASGTTRNHRWHSTGQPPRELLDPTRYLLALAPAATAAAARSGGSAHGRPVLRFGAKGPAVRDLQRALVAAGLTVAVDGDFGAATAAAVRDLQRSRGLDPDGVVGAATWGVLTIAHASEPPAEAGTEVEPAPPVTEAGSENRAGESASDLDIYSALDVSQVSP